MRSEQRFSLAMSPLPIILIAAVAQGWMLYGLHKYLIHFPSASSPWLTALYAVAVVIPLTVQVLSSQVGSKRFWFILGAIALAYLYFGYHFGSDINLGGIRRAFDSGDFAPFAFICGLLWILLMPFAQTYLASGEFRYASLFAAIWRNNLLLAEAGLFTGLFWLLLALWMTLFNMLGIDFFKELFQRPIFVYPVTTLVFGIALHLIGSVDRLTSVILEQILTVLKWLAIVAGFILAIFTLALLFKLPGLVFQGEKAIGAVWLLWLVAVTILLINAAYRDGSIDNPYPRWLAFALRCVIPLTIIVSVTALYALSIRARQYGLTVERIWAFVVAGTLLILSLGYSAAAVSKGRWLHGVGRVNTAVALGLIVTLAATLTPLLSPFRLAANSQFRIALENRPADSAYDHRATPFHYLRFDAGKYGRTRLNELAVIQQHPAAAQIRNAAQRVAMLENRWDTPPIDVESALRGLVVFPKNRSVDETLRAALIGTIREGRLNRRFQTAGEPKAGGVFIDLNSDAVDEFVLLHDSGGDVFKLAGNTWERAGTLAADGAQLDLEARIERVAKGDVRTQSTAWKELMIGDQAYRVTSP